MKKYITFALSVVSFNFMYAYCISTDIDSSLEKKPLLPVYTTRHLVGESPIIDGNLNDPCWNQVEWAGNFHQWMPNEGAEPSEPTYFKILYDNEKIYVAICAVEPDPEKIVKKGARRDESNGDQVGISFDSYHDHRTGFEFDVSSTGQLADGMNTNPFNYDGNWNAVWNAKISFEDSAWTAELEIPFSQLRYSSDSVQIWGLRLWRWIARFQEQSEWEPQSSQGPGMLYLFGELHGLQNLPRPQRFEIMPYSLGQVKTYQMQAENPFAKTGRSMLGNVGLDAKIGLSSNFTADITINPDFGQVEADLSVMNLSAFETLFSEKRPFFLEGKNIFSFDFDNTSIFYSRRIGHTPSYSPSLGDHEYSNIPDQTAIVSAVKLSGKTAGGLSLGVLQSLTANEQAQIKSAGISRNTSVEPSTNYAIVRVQQDYGEGNTTLGGIITSTNRFIKDSHLNFLNHDAYTAGADLLHQWNDKEYLLSVKVVASNINGSIDAIKQLQYSSARYYQRPDITSEHFDSLRTNLSGYGGSVSIGKASKGRWRYATELNWRSPGLDLNDLGFMQTADLVKLKNTISYRSNRTEGIFRAYTIGASEVSNWDYRMTYLSTTGNVNASLEFLNKCAITANINYTSQALDVSLLRGGSAIVVPAMCSGTFYFRTDPSRRIFFEFISNASLSDEKRSKYISFYPYTCIMPFALLRCRVGLNYSTNVDELQYIDSKSVNGATRYILGKIDQKTLGLTFRMDYNITPEFSIQYYGSPFVSIGSYSNFKTVANPRAGNYNDRFSILDPEFNGSNYTITENGLDKGIYSFRDPDFNFSQFRSNFVIRWEYMPGSQLYLVWSSERTSRTSNAGHPIGEVLTNIADIYPKNIFLIKLNYWFSA